MSEEKPAIEMAEDGRSYKIRRIEFPLRFPNGGYVDPSGKAHVEFELAPTTGDEEDMLVDEKIAKGNEQMRRILANCLRRVGDLVFQEPDARTKEEKEQALQVVDGLTINDSTFALLMLRRISLMEGDVHREPHRCSECGEEFTAVLDLSDLDVRVCTAPQREIVLPQSKKRVVFHTLHVADSPRLVAMVEKNRDSLFSASLFLRIASIDGKKPSSYRDLKKLSTVDREAIRMAMDDNESGIDLRLSIPCKKGHVDHKMLEPDVGFFLPSLQSTGSR